MHILYLGCQATNLLDFYSLNTLIFIAMVTMLSKDILQNLWLYEADCNLVYMNRILFILFVFNFKVKRSMTTSSFFFKI